MSATPHHPVFYVQCGAVAPWGATGKGRQVRSAAAAQACPLLFKFSHAPRAQRTAPSVDLDSESSRPTRYCFLQSILVRFSIPRAAAAAQYLHTSARGIVFAATIRSSPLSSASCVKHRRTGVLSVHASLHIDTRQETLETDKPLRHTHTCVRVKSLPWSRALSASRALSGPKARAGASVKTRQPGAQAGRKIDCGFGCLPAGRTTRCCGQTRRIKSHQKQEVA